MASTVSGMPGWRLRLQGPFRAASIQILRIGTHIQVRLPTIAAAGSSATRERMYLLPRPRLEFLLHRSYLSARGATRFSAVGRYPRSGDLPAALYQPSATEGTMSGTSAFTARLGNRLAGFDGQHGVHAHERRARLL